MTGIDGSQAEQIRRALQSAGRDMTTLHVREDALLGAVAAYPVVRSLRDRDRLPARPADHRSTPTSPSPPCAPAAGLTAVAGDGTLLRGSATRGLPVVAVAPSAAAASACAAATRSTRCVCWPPRRARCAAASRACTSVRAA